ncbi:MAG: hypothetical protein ACNA8W_25540 [Bradymonadaceae bacterium]
MKRPRHTDIILPLLVFCVLVAFGIGCTTPAPAPDRKEDTVLGRPPTPEEDPFFYIALPAEAVPAGHRGVIGIDEPAPVAGPTDIPEVVEPPPPKAEPDPPPKEVVAEVAKPTVLPEEPPQPKQPACFSCVRICPADASSSQCDEGPENLICGWGTHPEAEVASKVARGQCDATLDMARQMPTYSRIDGACPPASCR